MSKSERHYMIHKGKAKVVTAPVTRTIIDPESGEERTEEITPAKETTITLARGSRFGGYPVGEVIEVSDPKVRKALAEKGFEDHKPTKKEGATAASESGIVSTRLAEVMERDRERALGRVRKMADSRDKLDPEVRKALDAEAKKKGETESVETLGGTEGGK